MICLRKHSIFITDISLTIIYKIMESKHFLIRICIAYIFTISIAGQGTGKTIPPNSILEFSILSDFKMRNVIIWH